MYPLDGSTAICYILDMSKAYRNDPRRCGSSDSVYSLMEFEREFPDDTACLESLVKRLYPDGIFCPTCKAITKHHREAKRPSYACQNCGHHEHPMRGTIFQDSATSLKLWFYAIYIMSATRCGISAKQLGREIGVTYKTGWRIFHLIRKMLNENEGAPLRGKVEVDESYYGGKDRNRHVSKRQGHAGKYKGKAMVFGMVERGGRVVAKVVPSPPKSGDLLPHIKTHVLPDTMIFSDEADFYDPLRLMKYGHKRIRHTAKVYVSGDVHVNTLEGFWSLTKNGIRGVYRNVSQKHLQMYLDEYAFRFNRRGHHIPMFDHFMRQATRKVSSAV
jgi:transposase